MVLERGKKYIYIQGKYTEKLEKLVQNDNVKEKWEEFKVHYQKNVIKKGIKLRNQCLREKKWWDIECSKKKREVLLPKVESRKNIIRRV